METEKNFHAKNVSLNQQSKSSLFWPDNIEIVTTVVQLLPAQKTRQRCGSTQPSKIDSICRGGVKVPIFRVIYRVANGHARFCPPVCKKANACSARWPIFIKRANALLEKSSRKGDAIPSKLKKTH